MLRRSAEQGSVKPEQTRGNSTCGSIAGLLNYLLFTRCGITSRLQLKNFPFTWTWTPRNPPIVHGEDGVSHKGKGPTQASHYYSMTRMATTGNVTVGGERLSVTGMSWMDHEFGSGDLGEDQIGWDWFSVQLNNRTEIMLYLLRRRDGTVDPVSSGTFVLPDGQSQHLSLADFQVEPLDHWKSTSSGARYPSRWRISIPRVGLILSVTPKQADQELITERSTQVTYWEGAVAISGVMRDIPLVGEGYVELTGYAQPFSQR